MSHDVFISYAAQDKAIADGVCSTLEARKLRCWMAPRDVLAGTNYAEAIVEAINTSNVLVVVFSSHANESKHVMREVERCVRRGIPILPFRIENVVPSKSMEYFLSAPHWLDAMTPPLETHLNTLAETLTLLLERSRQPATAPGANRANQGQPVGAPEIRHEQVRGRPVGAVASEGRLWNIKKSWVVAVVIIVAAIIGILVLLITAGRGDASKFIYPIF